LAEGRELRIQVASPLTVWAELYSNEAMTSNKHAKCVAGIYITRTVQVTSFGGKQMRNMTSNNKRQ
jgi:hypothetical protein